MKKNSFIKFFLVMMTIFAASTGVFANIVPNNDIPNSAIGVYQLDKEVIIRENPNNSAKILYEQNINYSDLKDTKKDSFFSILVPNKELGYIYATDISDDEEWIQVIYDRAEGKRGWVNKKDDFQFLSWINFLNLYGRKYGLKRFRPDNDGLNGIYSNPDDTAQVIGTLKRPKSIRLISVEGEWMLVTVLDYSGDTCTGYIKWRTGNGKILLFPDIK